MQHEKECNTDSYGKTVDPFLKRYGSSEFVLEGHTHPDLGVFWSRTDRVSGAARAATAAHLYLCLRSDSPTDARMRGQGLRTGTDHRIRAPERKSQQKFVGQ